jgi:hypothetical protein
VILLKNSLNALEITCPSKKKVEHKNYFDEEVKVKVKVKVKFSLEQDIKAQRGSRGIALLFL